VAVTSEGFAERNNGVDDRPHRRVAHHVAHELPVDLDLVEGETREAGFFSCGDADNFGEPPKV
jgi:hypothetical protein